jgi:hypothetical protein
MTKGYSFNFSYGFLVIIAIPVLAYYGGNQSRHEKDTYYYVAGARGPPGVTGAPGPFTKLIETNTNIEFRIPRNTLKQFSQKLKSELSKFHPDAYIEYIRSKTQERYADYTLRIPFTRAHEFVAFAAGLVDNTRVVHFVVEQKDRSDDFRDWNADLFALEASKERLINLTDVDKLAAERDIRDLDMNIQRKRAALKELDQRVKMTSFSVTVREQGSGIRFFDEPLKQMVEAFQMMIRFYAVALTVIPFILIPVFGAVKYFADE